MKVNKYVDRDWFEYESPLHNMDDSEWSALHHAIGKQLLVAFVIAALMILAYLAIGGTGV